MTSGRELASDSWKTTSTPLETLQIKLYWNTAMPFIYAMPITDKCHSGREGAVPDSNELTVNNCQSGPFQRALPAWVRRPEDFTQQLSKHQEEPVQTATEILDLE